MKSIYTSLGFSIVIAVLVTYFYLYAFKPDRGGRGVKAAINSGWRALRTDKMARHLFWLSLYTAMILFRTLFNRDLWMNPLSKPFDGWGITRLNNEGKRTLSADCFGNLVMLMPFVALAIWTFPKWFQKKGFVKGSLIVAGSMSAFIELSQLLFRLGTFQFSDLFYNTFGGVAVGVIAAIYKKQYKNGKDRIIQIR